VISFGLIFVQRPVCLMSEVPGWDGPFGLGRLSGRNFLRISWVVCSYYLPPVGIAAVLCGGGQMSAIRLCDQKTLPIFMSGSVLYFFPTPGLLDNYLFLLYCPSLYIQDRGSVGALLK